MKTKGQAAMEFLMTYGWAILVVLAAIGALAYFGVLSPDKFIPEKCTMPPGTACLDFKVTETQTEMIIQNSMGRDFTINSITVNNCTLNVAQDLGNGDKNTFIIPCANGVLESKFKSDIVLDVTNKDTNLQKNIVGSMSGKIQ